MYYMVVSMNWGVLLVGVPIMKAFVYVRAPDFWKPPCGFRLFSTRYAIFPRPVHAQRASAETQLGGKGPFFTPTQYIMTLTNQSCPSCST